MRIFFLSILFLLYVSIPIVRATDVDYTLGVASVSEFAEQKVATPFSELVKDRLWAASGIEERVNNDSATCCFSDGGPRIKFEFRPQDCHVSYSMLEPEVRAPDWIGDALWPRTKEVLHYTSETRREPQKTDVVLFLGPPVCRDTFYREGGYR